MSLSITLTAIRKKSVFDANITHNLNKMADEAGIYRHLWRPDEINIKTAAELIEPLKAGLQKMKDNPGYFKQFEAENRWGTYNDFISWIEKYIEACEENPDAEVSAWR